MRLGGPVYNFKTAQEWVSAHITAGYGAAYWPDVQDDQVHDYVEASSQAGLTIAEVGAWSNPMSPDQVQRASALENCKVKLALADRVGARCCVNITGSLGSKWDGPCPKDLTPEAFEMIVQTTREIIDAVKPKRTFYTLETMPWSYPDSPDCYLELIKAIDRKQLGVHLDPVNMVNCPRRYFRTDLLLKESFAKLGPYICSCHGKDILMQPKLTVHLDEVAPGKGTLDYKVYLEELAKLPPEVPLMLEHMEPSEYTDAAAYIRQLADQCGLAFV